MLRMSSVKARLLKIASPLDDLPTPQTRKRVAPKTSQKVADVQSSKEHRAHRTAAVSDTSVPVSSRSIGRVLRILREVAPAWNAPVLSLMAAERQEPFLILIGCILSLRTKDQATAKAAERLFTCADSPSKMLELSPARIARLIYPVGFYRTKARVILEICGELLQRFEGKVPDRIEDLLTLKGVGRKTANLVVTEAFGKPGICVDTHVHRISNRFGLIKTTSPDKSEEALRRVLPRRYWIEYNSILVAFGQTICQPASPWCSRCPVSHLCPRISVVRSR